MVSPRLPSRASRGRPNRGGVGPWTPHARLRLSREEVDCAARRPECGSGLGGALWEIDPHPRPNLAHRPPARSR